MPAQGDLQNVTGPSFAFKNLLFGNKVSCLRAIHWGPAILTTDTEVVKSAKNVSYFSNGL